MPQPSASSPSNPLFLLTETALELHRLQVVEFGGDPGVRDLRLLESALAQPMATFGSEYLHPTVTDMAAAYLYHIVMNHPFVDGNKRMGLQCAIVFLEINGLECKNSAKLYDLTIGIAEGRFSKANVAEFLRKYFHVRRKVEKKPPFPRRPRRK